MMCTPHPNGLIKHTKYVLVKQQRIELKVWSIIYPKGTVLINGLCFPRYKNTLKRIIIFKIVENSIKTFYVR